MKFGKKNGYHTYTDAEGNERFTHRRVAEKKLGGELPVGAHVHHVDGDKSNNRPSNLVVLDAAVHARVHAAERQGETVCFKCGRSGHWAADCYAKTDFKGRSLAGGTEGSRKPKKSAKARSPKNAGSDSRGSTRSGTRKRR